MSATSSHKYSILLVDPPWKYAARVPHKERADGSKKPRFGEGAAGHYECMEDEEILAMANQVKAISEKNAALFLWVTMPRLPLGIQVLEAWGFRYATTAFTWIKTTKQAEGIYGRLREAASSILRWNGPKWTDFLAGLPATGPGYYTASNTEIVLLGVKGQMQPVNRLVNSVILSPRREHSRKPDEVRERIVQVFGDIPRVELFARHPAPGWDAFGNAVDGRDIRDALEVG